MSTTLARALTQSEGNLRKLIRELSNVLIKIVSVVEMQMQF
jgi:tRNA U34 5-carboxymethylaminomethyl modifying GTPase MnmE/TrmE